ncbi:hypothetical protein FQA39_LY15315 [Lamprigera yunnana]|nr:hypothetical protein FQA39_LY15315 [Lamprigera yunnana]
MSSALKPALTSSGAQNPPVPSQLNKPIHTQGASTTYGQPMSHIPQNIVNIPHNPSSSTSVHNAAHSNVHSVQHHINANALSAGHYSLNVPNASQHYPMSGSSISTHLAPVSNHPVPNTTQTHTQPSSTFSPSPKNLTYTPAYQSNLAHTYKMPNIPTAQITPVSQTLENTIIDKPQSNGTPDIKIPNKPESIQNHVTPAIKDKPLQPPQLSPPEIQTPSTPEKAKTVLDLSPNLGNLKEEEESQILNEEKVTTELEDDKLESNLEERSTVTVSTATDKADNSANTVSSTSNDNFSSEFESVPVSATAEPSELSPSQSTEVPENCESRENSSPTNTNKNREQSSQKTLLKVAPTPRNQAKKPKAIKDIADTPKIAKTEIKSSVQKLPNAGIKSKRMRTKTQPYQSPLPEVEMISKITATTPRSKNNEDKLIIFYKNEFLAVRNSEGGFYVCQAVQNIYKSSPRIRIRWLSQDKNDKELYTPDFYDNTDFDCILTNLNLSRAGKGKYKLPMAEKIRTDSILRRALAVEKGDAKPTSLTEEHPDGLDLSLYKEESQLKKRKAVKRKAATAMKNTRSSNSTKLPDQPKIQKVVSKPKALHVKKSTVLKKALATKIKKGGGSNRSERALKRHTMESKNSTKTISIIDQKKAKVLAKVARKAVVPQPKIQPPSKQNNSKGLKAAIPSKKLITTKKTLVSVTRKSKRGKK